MFNDLITQANFRVSSQLYTNVLEAANKRDRSSLTQIPKKFIKYSIRGFSIKSMTTNLPLKLDSLPETLQAEGTIRLELVEGIPIFRASDRIQNRIENLLIKQKESTLNSEEEKELDNYEELDDYLSLVNRTVRNSLLNLNYYAVSR